MGPQGRSGRKIQAALVPVRREEDVEIGKDTLRMVGKRLSFFCEAGSDAFASSSLVQLERSMPQGLKPVFAGDLRDPRLKSCGT